MKIRGWNVEQDDKERILFESPEGYVLTFPDNQTILRSLAALARRNAEWNFTVYGDRHFITDAGMVSVIDGEPWINPGAKDGDDIVHSENLAYVMMEWLLTPKE